MFDSTAGGPAMPGAAADTLDGLTAAQAAELIRSLEVESRRLEASKCDLLAAIGRNGLHDVDGHSSPKVMMRHIAQLSGSEAWARDKVTSVMAVLGGVADAYRRGTVGTSQIRRLAKTYSNPRVRHFMPVCESVLLEAAVEMEYIEFDLFISQFEELVDEDGADQKAERDHNNRNTRIIRDFNGSWNLEGSFGSLDGAELQEIHRYFTDAERLSDIEATKDLHGDDYRQHLPRTEQQLRADALLAIFRTAAGAPVTSRESRVVTNILIDQDSFERQIAKIAGAEVPDIDPFDPTRICRTNNGTPINAAEGVAAALVGHVRRVVYDAASVTIDLSEKARLFTGSARTAATLSNIRCFWPGCWVPASACEIDHLEPHTDGGRTTQINGAPLCGKHNRHKHGTGQHSGYRTRRDKQGSWHITRPDGTKIE
jgi:hypothetical protein